MARIDIFADAVAGDDMFACAAEAAYELFGEEAGLLDECDQQTPAATGDTCSEAEASTGKSKRRGRPALLTPKAPRKRGPRTKRTVTATARVCADEPQTIDVVYVATPAATDVDGKRNGQPGPRIPIPLWPQYKFEDGAVYLKIAVSEHWVRQLVGTLRGFKNETKTRQLGYKLQSAVRGLLTQIDPMDGGATRNAKRGALDLLDAASDDDSPNGGPTTLAFDDVEVRAVNSGKNVLFAMDANAKKFIETRLTDVICKLANAVDDAVQPVEDVCAAHYRESATPNIKDKLLWDPERNSFKLLFSKASRNARKLNPYCGKSGGEADG